MFIKNKNNDRQKKQKKLITRFVELKKVYKSSYYLDGWLPADR